MAFLIVMALFLGLVWLVAAFFERAAAVPDENGKASKRSFNTYRCRDSVAVRAIGGVSLVLAVAITLYLNAEYSPANSAAAWISASVNQNPVQVGLSAFFMLLPSLPMAALVIAMLHFVPFPNVARRMIFVGLMMPLCAPVAYAPLLIFPVLIPAPYVHIFSLSKIGYYQPGNDYEVMFSLSHWFIAYWGLFSVLVFPQAKSEIGAPSPNNSLQARRP